MGLGQCLMSIQFCSFVLPCLLSLNVSSVSLSFWLIVWFIIHFCVCIYYYFYIFSLSFLLFLLLLLLFMAFGLAVR